METKNSTCKVAKWILSGLCVEMEKPTREDVVSMPYWCLQLLCLLLQWILEVLCSLRCKASHMAWLLCRRDSHRWASFLHWVILFDSFPSKLHNRWGTSKTTIKWPASHQRGWIINTDSTQISRLVVTSVLTKLCICYVKVDGVVKDSNSQYYFSIQSVRIWFLSLVFFCHFFQKWQSKFAIKHLISISAACSKTN